MPAEVKTRLKEAYSGQLQKQLLLAGELQTICDTLNREGVFYLHLKGTILALQLYGKISERVTQDIDFLIGEKDIDKVLKLFSTLGYRIVRKERDKPEQYFRRIKKNYSLIHPGKRILVELHWGLFSNRFFYPEQRSLFEATGFQLLNQTPVRIMNRENTFLYLCMHGIYHEYFRLFWLRDIAEILKHWKPDYGKIVSKTESEGMLRIVASSAILAGEVFNITTPFDAYKNDPAIRWIVNHNLSAINRSSLPKPTDRFRRIFYFMKLKKGWRYKAECILGIARRYWIMQKHPHLSPSSLPSTTSCRP